MSRARRSRASRRGRSTAGSSAASASRSPTAAPSTARISAAPTLSGRSVVYCTDTIYCRSAVELSRGADLLIHEATFAEADEGLAVRSTHSTAGMAARVAKEAGARKLLMTHFSPRYFPGNQTGPDDLLREARAVFPDAELAHDFLSVDVERRE